MTAKPCSACRALCGNSGGFIMLRRLSFSSCLGEHVTVEKLPGRNYFLQLDVSIDKWRLVGVKRKREVRIGIMENTKVKIRCIFPEGNLYLTTVHLALLNKQTKIRICKSTYSNIPRLLSSALGRKYYA